MKKRISTVAVLLISILSSVNSQNLFKLTLQNPVGESSYQSSVPGFKTDKYDYEILLSANCKYVPRIVASGDGKVKVLQAKSIEGNESDRKAVITVVKGSQTNTYSVLFTKTKNIITGILYEDNGSSFTGGGFYTRDKVNHGEIWGDYSYRALSTAGNAPYLTSPVLENGAGKLSFWLTEDLLESDRTAELLVKVTTDGKKWKTIARFPAENLKTGIWEKKEVDINLDSPLTQIQFMIKRSGTQRDFRFDDITITPFNK